MEPVYFSLALVRACIYLHLFPYFFSNIKPPTESRFNSLHIRIRWHVSHIRLYIMYERTSHVTDFYFETVQPSKFLIFSSPSGIHSVFNINLKRKTIFKGYTIQNPSVKMHNYNIHRYRSTTFGSIILILQYYWVVII